MRQPLLQKLTLRNETSNILMKNERHLVSDNLDFDAGALDYKTRNNALIQIVIQALSDNHS
jgi:hypothetical protein